MKALLLDVDNRGRLLNSEICGINGLFDYFLSENRFAETCLGRALDEYIEVQIHRTILLERDVKSIAIDESYISTEIEESVNKLSDRYAIEVKYIPYRKIRSADINPEFRGAMIRPLVESISNEIAHDEFITPYTLGKAYRHIMKNPSQWRYFGSDEQLFQRLKQLWHVVAYFG
jgi:hypothetical protein